MCPGLENNTIELSIEYSHNAINDGEYPFGTRAIFTCMTGFALVAGDQSRICTGNGFSTSSGFEGTPPTCKGIYIYHLLFSYLLIELND